MQTRSILIFIFNLSLCLTFAKSPRSKRQTNGGNENNENNDSTNNAAVDPIATKYNECVAKPENKNKAVSVKKLTVEGQPDTLSCQVCTEWEKTADDKLSCVFIDTFCEDDKNIEKLADRFCKTEGDVCTISESGEEGQKTKLVSCVKPNAGGGEKKEGDGGKKDITTGGKSNKSSSSNSLNFLTPLTLVPFLLNRI